MDKRNLSERDICSMFITPALLGAGWTHDHFREEISLTDGRVQVCGILASRVTIPDAPGGPKRADYVLYTSPNFPIPVVEAKHNAFSVGHGMQQALAYAEMLESPFSISSNGDGFLVHDRTGNGPQTEWECSLEVFFPATPIFWNATWLGRAFRLPMPPHSSPHPTTTTARAASRVFTSKSPSIGQ